MGYFWGGKSLALDWDCWGTPMEVWAEGSSSTGTLRPFSLDCSGYVDWVFYNAIDGEYVIGHGSASAQHSYCEESSWEEAQPGNLAFCPGDEHVGIVCEEDENGTSLVIHCANIYNSVVVKGMNGFTLIARPVLQD